MKDAIVEVVHQSPFTDVSEFISRCSWSRQLFRTVTVSFDTPDFALIPAGLIQPGKEADLLSFQTMRNSTDVQTYTLAETAISVIYDTPAAIQDIRHTISGARIFPSSALFLRYIMGHNDRQVNELHVLAEPSYLLLSVMMQGKHMLTNHFTVESEEDVLYFVAHAAIRLGLDLEHAHCILYGQSISGSLRQLLSEYCLDVKSWIAPAGFYLPEDIDSCRHFSTLIHPICAS